MNDDRKIQFVFSSLITGSSRRRNEKRRARHRHLLSSIFIKISEKTALKIHIFDVYREPSASKRQRNFFITASSARIARKCDLKTFRKKSSVLCVTKNRR